jgi:hypothetical protein
VFPLAEQKEKKKEKPLGPDGEICRDLICADEWKDPATRKVLTEFHKEGLPKELVGVDADLENFEQYWQKKGGSVKVKGEYHKDGAPFLDREHGWDTVKKLEDSGAEMAEAAPPVVQNVEEAPKEIPLKNIVQPEGTESPASEELPAQGKIQRPIDMGLIEMISYALFRVVFSQGLSLPIKREGMVDMDVTVKGKEITINTNQLYFSVPELNVWHIVYQHKGKPIVELGRGVKNGMAIHRIQAIRLGLEMWNGSRKTNKLKLKQLKEADKKAHLEAAK